MRGSYFQSFELSGHSSDRFQSDASVQLTQYMGYGQRGGSFNHLFQLTGLGFRATKTRTLSLIEPFVPRLGLLPRGSEGWLPGPRS